jgi:hypothetical protein
MSSLMRRLAHVDEAEVMAVMTPLLPGLRKNDWGSESKARCSPTGGKNVSGGSSPDEDGDNGSGTGCGVIGGLPSAEPRQQATEGGEGWVLPPNQVECSTRSNLTSGAAFDGGK